MDVTKGKQAKVACGRPAFTLIELLVVIAVIAILAALILPALAKAKGKARAVKSLSNVKQWVYAFHMYEDDNEEYFPYEGDRFIPINMGVNLDAWYNVTTIYMTLPPLKDLYALGNIPLPGHNSVFVCPSVRKAPYSPSLSTGYFMYAFNNRMDPNGPERFKRSQVIYPSDTVTFTENDDEFPSTSGVYTVARHNLRANLGFVDGHAAPIHTNDFKRATTEDDSNSEFSIGRKVYWFPFKGALN